MFSARRCGFGVCPFGFGSGKGSDDVSCDVQYGVYSVQYTDAEHWKFGHSLGFEGAVSERLSGWGECMF